jgi:hypothetical protein
VGQDQGIALGSEAADFLNEFGMGHAHAILVGHKKPIYGKSPDMSNVYPSACLTGSASAGILGTLHRRGLIP